MKNLSKFVVAAAALLTLGFATSASAQSSGIFGAGVVLTGTNNTPTLYEFTQTTPNAFMSLGDSRYAPTVPGGGVTLGAPALDSTGGFSAGTENLGTFNISIGQKLLFDGGELLSFKNGGADVTGARIYYAINAGSYSAPTSLAFNQDNVNSNAGDQRWYTDGANINLLTGLTNGTYSLHVYLDSPATTGTNFANNNANPTNYTATFTVVPEPSTLAMMLSSSIFGTFYLLSRKRR